MTYNTPSVATYRRGYFYKNQACTTGIFTRNRGQKVHAKTIRSYRNNQNLFVRFLDEEAHVFDTEDLTLASVRKFSAYMVGRGKKGRYVNGLLKTAKSFIQYCYGEGYEGFNTKKNFKWCKLETSEHVSLMTKLIDIMEDDDNVQNLWHNWVG